jgi:hypothetical protein
MSQVLNAIWNVCHKAEFVLKYKPVDWSDEFINHLKNLKDAEKSIYESLSFASRSININIGEFETSHLIPLRKDIKKLNFDIKYLDVQVDLK